MMEECAGVSVLKSGNQTMDFSPPSSNIFFVTKCNLYLSTFSLNCGSEDVFKVVFFAEIWFLI